MTKKITFAQQKKLFLEEFSKHGVKTPALKAAGWDMDDLRKAIETDEAFIEKMQDGSEEAVDEARLHLRHVALHGRNIPVHNRGVPVWKRDPDTGEIELDENFEPVRFCVTEYSDRLLERYMESNAAEYASKTKIDHTTGGQPMKPQAAEVHYILPEGKTMEDYVIKESDSDAPSQSEEG